MTQKTIRKFYSPTKIKKINHIIGKKLSMARENAGLSQSDVALMVYGKRSHKGRISELETGKKHIDFYLFLLLTNIYGQSADYMLGLSVEPIHDVYASHINYVQLCAKKYFEPIIEQMTGNLVDYMVNVDKDCHYKLVELSRQIANQVMTDKQLSHACPTLHQQLLQMADIVRQIDINHARKMTQIHAQLDDIKRQDDPYLLDVPHQYSLPLPEPDYCVVDDEVVNG